VQHILSLIVFLALILAGVYGAFIYQRHRETLPMELEEFKPFLNATLKSKQVIWFGVAVVAELFGGLGFGFIVLLFALVPLCFLNLAAGKAKSWKVLEQEAKTGNEQWLSALGTNPLDRAKAIEVMFEQKSRTVTANLFERWSDKSLDKGVPDTIRYIRFGAERSLASMEFREREALRFAEHLNSLADGENQAYIRWCATLVWGDGKGGSLGVEWKGLKGDDPINDYMARKGLNVGAVINAIAIHANEVKNDPRQPETLRAVCQEAFQAIGGTAA
jgi:hypothetical protein